MSSDLKVTNIKHESSGSNNLVLGSDGNVSITNTLSAGTIGTGVTINAGTNVSGIGQLVGVSWNTNSTTGETTVTVESNKTYIGIYWAYSSNAGAPEIYRFTVDGSGSVTANRFREWSTSVVINYGTNTITADVSGSYEYATLLIYEEGKTVDLS